MTISMQSLESLWAHNRAMLPPPSRKVVVQKAGALYRVRYEGSAESVFSDGETIGQHRHKLKYFLR
jgi:hypothetical protein